MVAIMRGRQCKGLFIALVVMTFLTYSIVVATLYHNGDSVTVDTAQDSDERTEPTYQFGKYVRHKTEHQIINIRENTNDKDEYTADGNEIDDLETPGEGGPRRYLLVNSICEGLNMAKTGLLELMIMAKKSNRILVEPRVSRILRHSKTERQLSFGYGTENKQNSLRDMYDLNSVTKSVGVKMITFEEYMSGMSALDKPQTLEFQFRAPVAWTHPKPPACSHSSEQIPRLSKKNIYYQLFHGVVDEIQEVDSSLLENWQSKCIGIRGHATTIKRGIEVLQLDSNITTIAITSYIGRNTFVKTISPSRTERMIESWLYTKGLNDKADQIASNANTLISSGFAALHFRVVKLWRKELPYSKSCADKLLKVISEQLRRQNIRSIYIASDLVPEADKHNPVLAPYVDFIAKLAVNFRIIESVDRMDVSRDFLDQILCTKADLFLYTKGFSNDEDKCTCWGSHYTDYIIAHRSKRQNNINIVPMLQ